MQTEIRRIEPIGLDANDAEHIPPLPIGLFASDPEPAQLLEKNVFRRMHVDRSPVDLDGPAPRQEFSVERRAARREQVDLDL
jgi:hypothetical protein